MKYKGYGAPTERCKPLGKHSLVLVQAKRKRCPGEFLGLSWFDEIQAFTVWLMSHATSTKTYLDNQDLDVRN